MTVHLDDCSSNARIHAFATQFLPHDQLQLGNMIQEMQEAQFGASIFHFAKWENLYQSNRALSDEIRYVFDRKQLE